jgi:mannose-1-phosphate guanylyltransferase/mannose-6-phosphate isomerase
MIVTGEEHRFLASEQLREAGIAMGTALLKLVGRIGERQPMGRPRCWW